jgi:hypothetical protein
MENRVFFPQAALDLWMAEGTVDLQQGELTILAEGRRYKLVDAVRIVRELSGGGDPHDLVGRAKARTSLEQLGAEIIETSMLVGDAAYDVELGWLGIPVGTFAEYVGSAEWKKARGARATDGKSPPQPGRGQEPKDPKTDEDLLASLLAKNL